MKILMICSKFPYPPNDGGSIAMYNMVQSFHEADHEVTVLAMNTPKHRFDNISELPEEAKEKANWSAVDVNTSINFWDMFSNLFFDEVSYHVVRFESEPFREELEKILKKENKKEDGGFDVVQMETIFMMNYLDTVRKLAPNAVVSLRAHNVEHEIWARRAKKEKNFVKKIYLEETAKRLREFERKAMGKSTFDLVIPITDKDKKKFGEFTKEYVNQMMATVDKKGSHDEKLLKKLEKNGVEDWVIGKFKKQGPVDPVKRRIKNQLKLGPRYHISQVGMGFENLDRYMSSGKEPDPNSVIFIGALDWSPNQEGLDWFLGKVWPILAKRHPELEFRIAGRRMPNSYNNKRGKQIKVLGEVDDAYDYMLSGAIMVVPLLSGSGMRVKIVEGMALGKAIVCSEVAVEGIPATNGEHCFIENSPKAFANAITTLVERPNMIKVLGKNAQKLARKHFDNKEITQALLAEYQKLVAAKKKEAEEKKKKEESSKSKK